MTSSITSFPDRVDVDKFATLFSPATPRPSPTLLPADTDSESMNSRQYRPNSLASDPAAFVSVSAAEDPLSLFDFALPPPTATTPVSTLRFFGKFAQEAKEAAERNKRCVLDELLLHEDDPLYWLKDQGSEHASESNDALRPPSEPPESKRDILEAPEAAYSSLLDLDHDFFTSKPIHDNITASPDPSLDRVPIPIPRHSPTRSPTHPAPATLAPPVAITSTASSTPANELSDPLFNDNLSDDRNRSNSYQTLSSLSSRWMSSLLSKSNTLSSSSSTPTTTDGSPSLDMLFNVESSSSKPRARSSDPHRRSTSHAQTMPSVQLSHGTPFGQHHSRTSPFAPHIYSPPSGAPGFAGEQYDWDRGFSAELGLEIERDLGQSEEVERGRQGREMVHVGQGEGGREEGRAGVVGSPVHIRGVGDLMEKKSGHVQLDGRKAVTSVVLDVDLADMVRPTFPPFSSVLKFHPLLLVDPTSSPSPRASSTEMDTPILSRPTRYLFEHPLRAMRILTPPAGSTKSAGGSIGGEG
jgi:hypothetical protein